MGSRIHWHVFLTHFPIALFGVSFLFQILHLFSYPDCFEMSTNISLTAGVASLGPVTWTGWLTWKNKYKGARVPLFQRKIAIAIAMLVTSAPLVIWRLASPGVFQHGSPGVGHWVYVVGNTLFISGAAAEGLYGGRLNHH